MSFSNVSLNTVRRALNSDRRLLLFERAVTEYADEINKPIPDPLVDLDASTLSNVVRHLPFSDCEC